MMHRTSTNVLGSQMLIRIPTAIQNKAKPATLFTVTLPFHWLLIPFYDSKPVCYADASLFFMIHPECRSVLLLTFFPLIWT